MSLFEAYVIMFIASFCSLVIEMVAGRILAPFVGVSIYTWTSIIGVILAGISIGAYIGGKLVDRFPTRRTLGWLLLLSGITALSIIPLTHLVAGYKFPLSLMMRIFLVTTIIFFVPGCILGTISPVVVRLTLKNLDKAGNVIGKIYAMSTLGAIIGTFATGFVLISYMGTRTIILTMGIILILAAVLSGALFRSKVTAAIFVVIMAPLVWGTHHYLYAIPLSEKTYLYRESDYYTIKLTKTMSADGQTELDAMVLDNLIHSYVALNDPYHVEYEYERIYADVLKWKFAGDDSFSTLTIGGGGYTFPRWMEIAYPKAHIDVVEIDPEVTKNRLRLSGNAERDPDTIVQHGRPVVCDELQSQIRCNLHRRLQRPVDSLPPHNQGVYAGNEKYHESWRHRHVQHHRQLPARSFSAVLYQDTQVGLWRSERLPHIGQSRLQKHQNQHIHRHRLKRTARYEGFPTIRENPSERAGHSPGCSGRPDGRIHQQEAVYHHHRQPRPCGQPYRSRF